MAIYIPDMNLPKERKMLVIEPNGEIWEQVHPSGYFATGVTAREIPNNHGKLKDVDDIVNRLALKPTHDAVSTLLSIQSAIDESPTIVESNVGICSSTERTVE